MAATSHGFAPWVAEAWKTAVGRVRGAVVAEWLWSRVLTADDRARLGGDLEAVYKRDGGATGTWQRLRGVTFPQAVVAVGTALNLLDPVTGQALLRAFGEAPDDPAKALDHAVAAGGLVLTEFPRQAWWRGGSIPIDWATRERPWAFLAELARQSKAGAAVDRAAIDGGGISDPRYVTKARSRLVRLRGFPADLAASVVSAGRGTYRLALPPDRIRVFVRGAGDALREWSP